MSTHSTPRSRSGDFSGEHVLFAMAAAFLVVLAAIIVAAFMPIALGVGLVFVVLAVVLAAVGVFLARLLDG
jgi:nitrogen fixation protein FixH